MNAERGRSILNQSLPLVSEETVQEIAREFETDHDFATKSLLQIREKDPEALDEVLIGASALEEDDHVGNSYTNGALVIWRMLYKQKPDIPAHDSATSDPLERLLDLVGEIEDMDTMRVTREPVRIGDENRHIYDYLETIGNKASRMSDLEDFNNVCAFLSGAEFMYFLKRHSTLTNLRPTLPSSSTLN